MRQRLFLGLGFAPLIFVLLVAILVADEARVRAFSHDDLLDRRHTRPLEIDTTAELETLFDALGYHWPPPGESQVPPLVIKHLPADFPAIAQTEERKRLFLRVLLPMVLMENRRIREQRDLVQWLFKKGVPTGTETDQSNPEYVWLTDLAQRLNVNGDLQAPDVRALLLRRLDEIPPALALAQGAIESGWGTSRFALEGNSLFGQWTFEEDAGIEPSRRRPEDSHLVASFPDLRASVRAYMNNLNSSRAYREFRAAREAMRAAGQELSPSELAGYLLRYSERGPEYVQDLRTIINSRTLAALNGEPAVPPQALLTTVQPASVIR